MEVFLGGVAYALPERIVTNEELQRENPDWDIERIAAKTGIRARRVVSDGETAADLGVAAAERLLTNLDVDRNSIDFLLFCTQSPDYVLPATACVLQERLQLSHGCGAVDFNQGCSGFVYGLALAKGLVTAAIAKRVLLITAETYSRYVHPRDRAVRVLFGDGSAACLVQSTKGGARIDGFALGTDGEGFSNLIVPAGGARRPACLATKVETTDDRGSTRTPEHLFMDGQELFNFTLKRVPEVVTQLLQQSQLTRDDIDWFLLHQANAFMQEHLRMKLKIPKERAPIVLDGIGNTVSSSIPIAMAVTAHAMRQGQRVMLVGFGVGYSWGACLLKWGAVPTIGPG